MVLYFLLTYSTPVSNVIEKKINIFFIVFVSKAIIILMFGASHSTFTWWFDLHVIAEEFAVLFFVD